MAYADISSYITKLAGITQTAIQKADFFAAAAAAVNFTPPIATPPTAPNIILEDPTFKNLNPPSMPAFSGASKITPLDLSLSIDKFTATLPQPPGAFSGSGSNTFNEAYPAVWLIDKVKTALRKLWSETGFESVEEDIWEKGLERNLQALYDAEDMTIAKHSMSGWSLPNDMADRDLEALNMKYDSDRLLLSSEISARMIDLAQKNSQFAVEHGLNGEAMLIAYFNRYAGRALKAARIGAEAAFEGINAKVIGYNAYLRANEAEIKAMSDGERARISEYEAFLDAKTAELDGKLDIFLEIVSAYKTLIDSYKTTISAEGSQGRTEMAWREVNYRVNLAGIQATLETAIANMSAINDSIGNSQEGVAMKAQTKVNNVAAVLGEMQVMLSESNNESTTEEWA